MNALGYEGTAALPAEVQAVNDDRDRRILIAARELALRHGLRGITRQAVAELAGMSVGSVSNYGRARIINGGHAKGRAVMDTIRDALVDQAVAGGDLVLLRMGLADQHPVALAAPEQLRVAALTA